MLRSLHTDFLDEWTAKREEARRERDRLRGHIVSTHQAGRQHETLLTAGQTAGGIKDILSVAEIMRRLGAEAEAALSKTPGRGHAPQPAYNAVERTAGESARCHRGRRPSSAIGTTSRSGRSGPGWDSWAGIGPITVGMARQGFDLQLTRYDDRGWRAAFYSTGMEHSPTSTTGTGWERTPWHATQRAAWEALNRRPPIVQVC